MNATPRGPEGTKGEGLERVNSCPFCGSMQGTVAVEHVEDFFFKADPGSFEYLRCDACRSLWLSDRPMGERLINAYATYYTHNAPRPPAQARGARGWLHNAYVNVRFRNASKFLERLAVKAVTLSGRDNSHIDEQFRFAPPAPASLLDYGCGSGEFLLKMRPLGYSLSGAEYDPAALTNLERLGIAVEDVEAIGDGHWDRSFDHITLSHVLEHVPHPCDLLKLLHDALKPGGTAFVEVPNADATGLAIFGRLWRGLEAPRHFALPNRSSLSKALQAAGFVVGYQHINISARARTWTASLEMCDENRRAEIEREMADAPTENVENAEFLTFVAHRPV